MITYNLAIGVLTTIQINQQKTPKLLDLILIVHQLFPQPLLNNIGGVFLFPLDLDLMWRTNCL